MPMTRTATYWDPEMDTLPWPEVLRWQGTQLPAFLRSIAGSPFYGPRLAGGDPDPGAGGAALARLPFTTKDELRGAQAEATETAPFGAHQVVPLSDIVQTVSSSGTTGKPAYYALTARDVRRWTDTVANTWFTAGMRPGDT